MKDIVVTCSSPETAILSKSSTVFLTHLLNKIWIDNVGDITKVYNKLKTFRPTSNEEASLLFDVIKSVEFKELYEKESIDNLNFVKNNEDDFSYSNLLVSLTRLATIWEVQHLLISNSEVKYWWNLYRRIIIEKDWVEKQKFCEIVKESTHFTIAIDLKSWKQFILDKISNEIILSSKGILTLNRTYSKQFLPDNFRHVELSCNNSCENIVFPWWKVEFSENSYVYVWEYALFIVDTKLWILTKVEKKNLSVNETDISYIDSIIWKWHFIITSLHHLNDEEINHDWEWDKLLAKTDLFNLELNRNIIDNIDETYIDLSLDNSIICINSELEFIYYIDLKSWKIIEYKVSDFLWTTNTLDKNSWKLITDNIKELYI